MQWIDLLAQTPSLYLVCVAIFGLLIGSFLNVVILRLPIMLLHDWTLQCYEFLKQTPPALTPKPFNLVTPRSQCPHCQHPIGALENIPVISFLLLKGRCKACHQPISWRYPLIEILTAIFSVVTAYYFGFTWIAFFALIFTWALIVLTMIDIDHQLLPDNIVLPLLWLGIILNIFSTYTDLKSAVLGVVFGYLFLWLIYWLFKLITHKEGMGHGDFKLLAMLGAWLGWQALPEIILLSSAVGAIVGITLVVFKKHARSKPIPFGPFLAMAGWISLLWGDTISNYYFRVIGIT